MLSLNYTSYRLPNQDKISKELFLLIRNMTKDQFDSLLKDQINQMKINFWNDNGRLLKFSLCALVVSLIFIPVLGIIAAIAFVAGCFGLLSLAFTAISHSSLKSKLRGRMMKLRKIARASTSYSDFLSDTAIR